MKGNWGTPPWHVRTPIVRAPMPRCPEVIVVGAGFTGLAAAYRLARMGARGVTVLEAGRAGAGASGHTGGIVLEGTAIGDLLGVDDCVEGLERLLRETDIDCAMCLCGCWELEHTRPDRPFLWRDGDSVLRVCESVPGGTLDPGALLSGLVRAALDSGVTIHEHHRVRAIEPGTPTRLHIIRDNGDHDVLSAPDIILATNAYTPTLVSLPQRFDPALALALCTERLDADQLTAIGLAEGMPFYTVDLPYLWGRPLADGRIVFGSGLVFHPTGDLERIDIGAGDAAVALDKLEKRVRNLHPALSRITVETRWGGPIAFLVGRPPLLGPHPAATSLLVAGGYTGHGIALSLRVGELAAGAIAKQNALPAWGKL